MIIYGINYSKQAEKRSGGASFTSHILTGDAGVTTRGPINLKEEMNRTNNKLGERNNQQAKKIKDEYKAQVEVPANRGFNVM